MDSRRMLAVQAWLDAARDKLQAELDKGAEREKSLVTSYEKSIEDLKDELKMHTSTVGETVRLCEVSWAMQGLAVTTVHTPHLQLYKAFEQICSGQADCL